MYKPKTVLFPFHNSDVCNTWGRNGGLICKFLTVLLGGNINAAHCNNSNCAFRYMQEFATFAVARFLSTVVRPLILCF